MQPSGYQWWLGLDTSGRTVCLFCLDIALNPLVLFAFKKDEIHGIEKVEGLL